MSIFDHVLLLFCRVCHLFYVLNRVHIFPGLEECQRFDALFQTEQEDISLREFDTLHRLPCRIPDSVVQLPSVVDLVLKMDSDASVEESDFYLSPSEEEEAVDDPDLVIPDLRLVRDDSEVGHQDVLIWRCPSAYFSLYKPVFAGNTTQASLWSLCSCYLQPYR